jgi:hypothetical protein
MVDVILDKINYMGLLSIHLDRIVAAFTEGDYERAMRALDALWCLTWKDVRRKIPNPSQVIEEKRDDQTVYPLPSVDEYGVPLIEDGKWKSTRTGYYIQQRMYWITRDVMRDSLTQMIDAFYNARVLMKTYVKFGTS